MNQQKPYWDSIFRINRRRVLQYGLLTPGTGIVTACSNSSDKPSEVSPSSSPIGQSQESEVRIY